MEGALGAGLGLGQIQGWGERPEVTRTPEFGSGHDPIILGAPGH